MKRMLECGAGHKFKVYEEKKDFFVTLCDVGSEVNKTPESPNIDLSVSK